MQQMLYQANRQDEYYLGLLPCTTTGVPRVRLACNRGVRFSAAINDRRYAATKGYVHI
jgi:hypothetical protein